jgi:predicted RNA binding protein YcfA (HicA-like mRNA interferase family)
MQYQYPLADWCRQNLPVYSPNEFFNKFIEEHQPNSSTLVDLGKWLYQAFPNSHLHLQNIVWHRVEGGCLIGRERLIKEIAYEAFKQRESKIQAEDSQKAMAYTIPNHKNNSSARDKLKTLNLHDLSSNIFGDNGFKAACLQSLNDLPDRDMPISDTVCILLNLEVFHRSFKGTFVDIHRSVGVLIVGILQTHGILYLDSGGKELDGNNFQQSMRNQAIDRAKHLEIKFKEGPNAKCDQLLINLCLLIRTAFENDSKTNLLSQPVDELLGPIQRNRRGLSLNLCKNYLQASRNLVKLISEEFRGAHHKRLRQILDKFYWDLGGLLSHFKEILNPVTILNAYNQISLLLEKFKVDIDSYYATLESSQDGYWLYCDRNVDLSAIKTAISQPLVCFQNHLKNALNDIIVLSEDQKTQLLPNVDNLRIHLKHLYEQRTVISRLVDVYRQCGESKFNTGFQKTSGRSFYKTIADFDLSPNRVKLSNLITFLNQSADITLPSSGNLLCNVSTLKMALPDYLEVCLEESIGDAEEALEATITFASLIAPKYFEESHQVREEVMKSMGRVRAFLEAVAWLKNYFFVQQPIWERPLIDANHLKAEVIKKKVKKKSGKNQKKGSKVKKKVNQPVETKSAIMIDDGQETLQKRITMENSSNSDDEAQNPVVSQSEIWKAKVEQFRAMRQMAKRLKQTGDVHPEQLHEPRNNHSFQEVLGGVFRRKLTGELALLRKSKVSEIINELITDGWTFIRVTGDHHIYTHSCLVDQVVIPYTSESEQLKRGTFNNIAKAAGWMERS